MKQKVWNQKFKEAQNSFLRATSNDNFSMLFYNRLFELKPALKLYFKNTDFIHQHKALMHGLDHLFNFNDEKSDFHKKQIIRIGKSHAKTGLNIHPQDYYYWIEALIDTIAECDKDWFDELEKEIRECIFFPISYIISLYHLTEG